MSPNSSWDSSSPNLARGGLAALLALTLLLPFSAAAPAGEEGEEEPQLTAADIPARIADAEVGDWVLYRLGQGGESRLTVVEKYEEYGDTYLVIQNAVTNKGKRVRTTEDRISIKDSVKELRELGPEDKVTRSQVLVHGRRINAVVVHFVDNGRVVRQSYFSDKIPVYGLVRGVAPLSKVKNVLTLLDYGFADEEE